MAAIDTNVLVQLLTQDDPILTAKAEAYLLAQAPVWVSVSVLVETFYVLARLYGWEKSALLAMLETICNSRQFIFQDQPAIVDATRHWVAAKPGFVDCLNVALARVHGKGPMATFDKDAAMLPGAAKL